MRGGGSYNCPLLFIKPPAMRTLSLLFVILLGMRIAEAQTACTLVLTGSATWTNESATSLGITGFGGAAIITGDFIVDTPLLIFSSAQVGFKSGCNIVVLPGCELRIVNSTFSNIGTQMWQGVVVLPGGKLVVNNSNICSAVEAVKINNGFSSTAGSFDIRNSLFRYNYINLEVTDYTAGTYPGYVIGTHFEGGSLAPNGCDPPGFPGAPTTNTYRGISISQVSGGDGLTLGDATTAPAGANRFTDMDLGIYALNSTVRVFNNEFEDIQDIAGFNLGYAVYAEVNPPGPYELIVGNGSNRANTMTDCRNGVFSTGMRLVNVSDNNMNAPSGPFEIGVEVNRTADSIIVAANTIENFTNTGIILDDNPGSGGSGVDASVNNNTLEGTFDETVGVFVNLLDGGVNVNINSIDQVFRGIVLQSLSTAGQVQVDTNTINFGYAGISSQAAGGILSLDVAEPIIYKNTISGNCPYPGGGGPCHTINLNNSRIRGIVLYRSPDAKVFLNYIEHSGAGMFVLQDNLEGNAICNEFHDSYSGVVWDNVDSAEFGKSVGVTNRVYGLVSDSSSSENRWTSSIGGSFEPVRSYSINGSQAHTIDWYYRNAATYDFPGGGTNLDDGGTATPLDSVLGSPSPICDILAQFRDGQEPQGLAQAPSGAREEALDRALVLGSSSSISPLLYAYLRWAYAFDVADSRVQIATSWTNIPKLDSIHNAWQADDLEAAQVLLESVNPINSEEELYKQSWRLRVQRALEEGRDYWTPEEVEHLLSIAHSDWEEAGSAAVFAQSLLGVTIIPDEWHVEMEEELRQNAIQIEGPKIVPNPATNLAYLLNVVDYQSLRILDMQGTIWLAIHLNGLTNQPINIQDLVSGVYLVQLISRTDKPVTLKLNVAK